MVFSLALRGAATFVKIRFHFKLHQHHTTVQPNPTVAKASKTLRDVRGNLTYLLSARLEQMDVGILLKHTNKNKALQSILKGLCLE